MSTKSLKLAIPLSLILWALILWLGLTVAAHADDAFINDTENQL